MGHSAPRRPEAGRAPRLRLDLQIASRLPRLPGRAAIRRWAAAALADGGGRPFALTVRIVDEAEGAALNEPYRRKPGATNVLSFGYEPAPGLEPGALGDIVICAPVVRREARAQGKAEAAHWAHMVVHGIMHLRGYDHVRQRDAAVMEAAESVIITRLGFPDPYA